MEKAAAERHVLEQWRALPQSQRVSVQQALVFADKIAAGLKFETLGNPRSIVRAWVMREFQKQGIGAQADGLSRERDRSKL